MSSAFPDQVEYQPGTGHQKLTDTGHLQVCEGQCEVEHITVKLHLETKHIGKGCDRDTYSIASQRKLCGEYIYKVHTRKSIENNNPSLHPYKLFVLSSVHETRHCDYDHVFPHDVL